MDRPAPQPGGTPLAGRRALSLGVFLICLDTPTFRLVKLTAPPKAPLFGISFLLWRTLLGSLASLILVLHTVGGGFGGLRDQLQRIGSRTLAASTATNVVGNLSFTSALAVARLTLKVPLANHTWAAVLASVLFLFITFSGSFEASSWRGTLIACLCPLTGGLWFTLCNARPDVDLQPSLTLSLAVLFLICLFVLARAGELAGALPLRPRDVWMLLLNAGCTACGMQLMALGAQTVPGAEVALLALLETPLGPLLTYLAVGEVPSKETMIAGALIVLTLAAHALYERHLEERAAKAASEAGGVAEGLGEGGGRAEAEAGPAADSAAGPREGRGDVELAPLIPARTTDRSSHL